MTLLDIVDHDWKKGDKVWALMFDDIDTPGPGYDDHSILMPVDIKQLTVSRINKRIIHDNTCDVVELTINFDGYGKYDYHINTYLKISYAADYIQILRKFPKLNQYRITVDVDTKFFSKEEALAAYAQFAEKVRKNIRRKIDEFTADAKYLKDGFANGMENLKDDLIDEFITDAESLKERLDDLNGKIDRLNTMLNKVGQIPFS